MQSVKGGWELRNAKTKISNSPKYYSCINPSKITAIVFEGFMDVLSYFTLYGYSDDYTYLILNSVGFVAYVPWADYHNVLYYGDCDTAGDRALEQIKERVEVADMRYKYHGFKDLNAYLMDKKCPQNSLYTQAIKAML